MHMLFERTHLMRLVGILLVVGLCFSFSHVSAETLDIGDAKLINALKQTSEENPPERLKKLIENYCSIVLSS